jgi:multiple sugar transport system substrate-binding protein
MNLLEKDNITKVYSKNNKKSISSSLRIDVFLVISVLFLLASPAIFNLVLKIKKEINQTDLYISPLFEELFGKETMGNLIQEFEEQNFNLRIRPQNIKSEKKTEQGQNSAPDILIFNDCEAGALAAPGAPFRIMTFTSPETGETQTAAPLVTFMDLLFYNIEILKAAGLDRPPKTREEFIACAKTISGTNSNIQANISGTAMGLNPADGQALTRDIFSWIWAAGGDFWSAEKGPVINTRPIAGDINFLGSLYREGALSPVSFDKTGEQRLEEFAQGKIAMMIFSTSAIPYLREKMGDEAFGVTVIPVSGTLGKYGVCIFNYYAAINENCAHPDGAVKFLLFLTGKKPLLCAELKAVPGDISELFSGDYLKNDPFYSKARDIFESSAIVRGFYGTAEAQEFENAVREELRIFFEGSRSAQVTVNAIQKRWEGIFLENE